MARGSSIAKQELLSSARNHLFLILPGSFLFKANISTGGQYSLAHSHNNEVLPLRPLFLLSSFLVLFCLIQSGRVLFSFPQGLYGHPFIHGSSDPPTAKGTLTDRPIQSRHSPSQLGGIRSSESAKLWSRTFPGLCGTQVLAFG